jgi:branched-chain amino acid transport system permease protein
VDVASVTSRVWLLAGLLSGVAAIIPALFQGASQRAEGPTTIPVGQLVVILTVLVIARFSNIWFAAAGAFVLSILQSAVQLSYSSQAPLDAAFVFIVGALLLLQRERQTRAAREDFSGLDVTRELRPIPSELRGLPTVRGYVRTGWLVVTAVLIGLPWALSVAKTSLLVDSFGLVIVGLSILVLTGWAGQVSLGQFGFAAIGAWAAASSGWPFVFALLLAAFAGAVAALIVGLPAMKLKGLSLAISTIAFAVSAHALFIDTRYFGRTLPDSIEAPHLLGFDLGDEKTTYYMTLLFVAAACAVVIGLRRSRTGRVLIALRANEAAGQSFGINPLRARLTAFSVSGAMAAVAGALLAYHLGRVAPEAYSADKSLVVFLYTVVGGLGGIAGPILGMFFYACVFFFFSGNALVQYAAAGTGAVLLMLMAPGGLAQLAYGARDAMLRRIAFRLRIPVPSLMGDKGAVMTMDRAPLDDKREAPRRPGELLPLRYKPPGQWALARYGSADATKERVGG